MQTAIRLSFSHHYLNIASRILPGTFLPQNVAPSLNRSRRDFRIENEVSANQEIDLDVEHTQNFTPEAGNSGVIPREETSWSVQRLFFAAIQRLLQSIPLLRRFSTTL